MSTLAVIAQSSVRLQSACVQLLLSFDGITMCHMTPSCYPLYAHYPLLCYQYSVLGDPMAGCPGAKILDGATLLTG